MMRFCPQCATALDQRLFEGKLRPTCSNCGYIAFADPKVAATVLVERAGKVLLARRAIDPGRGLWCFPGGYVDFGEDPAVAAIRECWEETGLVITELSLLDVTFNGRVIVITYLAHASADLEPIPGDDADMAQWFASDSLPPLAFPNMSQAIMLWQEKSKEQRTKNKE
jgi:ADP-ribose pyrophosphatase YjhB (NUDIX family)